MPKAADIKPVHFGWSLEGKVATITLNRPERKNPLTFESYAELRDLFRGLNYVDEVKAVVRVQRVLRVRRLRRVRRVLRVQAAVGAADVAASAASLASSGRTSTTS